MIFPLPYSQVFHNALLMNGNENKEPLSKRYHPRIVDGKDGFTLGTAKAAGFDSFELF